MRFVQLCLMGLLWVGGLYAQPLFVYAQPPAGQPPSPLKLNQIERLLDIKFEDQLLAREIERRGLAFRLDEQTFDKLEKRGLQPLAQQALRAQADAQVYAAFSQETDDFAKRLALGRLYLRDYPQGRYAPLVRTETHRLEFELLTTTFQTLSPTLDSNKLNQFFQLGKAWLKEPHEPEPTGMVLVWLALAAARGTLAGLNQELEQSQLWTNQAVSWLAREPFVSSRPELAGAARSQILAELYRAQALYLLRQVNADPDQALVLLNTAQQSDPTGIGSQALTFWLQALARDYGHQRVTREVAGLEANTPEWQVACANLQGWRGKLVDDYTRVIALSADPRERSLHEEASHALKKLLNAPNPCQGPAVRDESRPSPQTSLPAQQRARKVRSESIKAKNIYISSKTVYLKSNQLEAVLLKRALFQSGEWRVIRNQKEADYIIEITLPFMSWNWTYEVLEPASSALMAAGKLREATAGAAIPRLAEELERVFQRLRVAAPSTQER